MGHGVQKQKAPIPSCGSHSAERRAQSENKTQKKEPYPSRHREVELSQRTGQLLIVCLLGRGTPLVVTLSLYKLSVKDTLAQGIRRRHAKA